MEKRLMSVSVGKGNEVVPSPRPPQGGRRKPAAGVWSSAALPTSLVSCLTASCNGLNSSMLVPDRRVRAALERMNGKELAEFI